MKREPFRFPSGATGAMSTITPAFRTILPKWASGLTSDLQKSGDEWLADGPAGKLRLRFAPPNKLGVLDHWVTTETGEEVYIPLRAVANGESCEVIFTLFRLPGMDDEKFAADAAWVMGDLQKLKDLLEAQLIE